MNPEGWGAGPGSLAFTLAQPDVPYAYSLVDTDLYEVRLNGQEVATVMFRSNVRFASLAMQGMTAALNAAVAE